MARQIDNSALRLSDEQRARIIEYLVYPDGPYYTLHELSANAREFSAFLESHRTYLLQTGLPPEYFSRCRWMHHHLARLYDTRRTDSPYPPYLHMRNAMGAPYQWLRATIDNPKEVCEYEDADYLRCIVPNDGERLEREREKWFELKLQVLSRLGGADGSENAMDLWSSCLEDLSGGLSVDDLEFYLRVDRSYLGLDSVLGNGTAENPKMAPGGLLNLLEVVGRFAMEIQLRTYTRPKERFGNFQKLATDSNVDFYAYLSNRFGSHVVDQVAVEFSAALEAEDGLWREYEERARNTLFADCRAPRPITFCNRHASLLQPLIQHAVLQLEQKADRGEPITLDDNTRSVFRRFKDSWTIQFAGETRGLPDRVGCRLLSYLLRRPDKPFTATSLMSMYRAETSPLTGESLLPEEAIGEEMGTGNLSLGESNLGDTINTEGEEAINKAIRLLYVELEDAAADRDDEKVHQLRRQITELDRRRRQGRGPGGRPMKLADPTKNDRDNVRSRLNEVLSTLDDAHPTLAAHLRQSLELSPPYCYRPTRVIHWEL